MPVTGISNLYTSFATDVIKSHVENNTIHAVSRASIERELITQLDRATNLNVDYKIAWYHAILETPLFDSLWYSLSIRHSLPPHATERYTVEASLYEYEVLTSSARAKPSSTKTSSTKPSSTKTSSSKTAASKDSATSKAVRKPNKAMRYIAPSPAVSGPPPRSSQNRTESDPSFPDASSSSSSAGPSSSSSSDEDEDAVDEEAAALGKSLYENAIASTPTTTAPTPPPSKVVGGAGRIGVGVKTRNPGYPKKSRPAEKVEEPGDGAYNASSATVAAVAKANGRAGGGRKGIDRKAGAKGKAKKTIPGKGGLKFDKGKVVTFAGLEDGGKGKENTVEVEMEMGVGKRQRVPTEKVMLAMQ